MNYLELFHDTLKGMVEEVYLEEVLSGIMDFIKKNYNPQSAAVLLYKDGLKVKISRGLSYTFIKQLHKEGSHTLYEYLKKEKKLEIITEEHPVYPTSMEHSYKCMVLVPLLKEEEVIGMIFMDFSDKKDISDEDQKFLETLGYLISVALTYYEDLDRLEDLINHDPLTGVYNFKHFHELLYSEVQRANDTGHPFAMALVAITGLKEVNERYGHVPGDQLLKFVAEMLQKKVRRFDIVARYAAAKFVVIFPEADKEWAKKVAQEIIDEFTQCEWCKLDVEVYLDIGIVAYPEDAEDEKTLLNRLEACVHEAKRFKGHNIVTWPFQK
ncbi:sensor domain-containing diguanylate cyclase [Thermosulfidibacter takaii]|nr:GGDEF domain-containing protein [Thermosulfidibacter takaii]